MNEPIADAIRGILDGHIVLSRELAMRSHYPPIDVIASLSRVMVDVVPEDHLQAAHKIKHRLATHRQSEDLIRIGAYAKGSHPELDKAIEQLPHLESFLRQGILEKSSLEASVARLKELAAA
jgi:flagellum-specific ATP synthase